MNAAWARLSAAAGGLVVASAVMAQGPLYRDVTATQLPSKLSGPCMDAAAGDADGDGDLDLVLAMEFEPNVLLLNDGTGRFTIGIDRLPSAVHDSEDVAFADFDRDGDLDLVLVSEDDRADELYINDGAGRFTDASARLPTDEVSNALAVMDLDGDGVPDVLTGNVGMNRVLIADGRGGFREETAARWPQAAASRTQDLELADIDGDGDLDVLVGNEGQNQLFLNDAGRLVDGTSTAMPAREDETREIRAADVDGDGDLDLIVANVSFGMEWSPQDYLLLNDGAGRFTTAAVTRFPEDARSNFTVQTADLDGDGDLDVLAPSTVFPRTDFEFLVFVTDAQGRAAVVRAANADVRDVDGDGDTDIVELGADGSVLHTFANEAGRLTLPANGADTGGIRLSRLDEVDTNDDGRPDLTVGSVELYAAANAGEPDAATRAGDTDEDALPPARAVRTTFQLADIDRDGDIDVAIPRTAYLGVTGDYLVLLNDGAGRFSRAAAGTVLPAGTDGNGFDVEVADFDADGATDLFLCNRASMRGPENAAASGGLQRLLVGRRP